ncbi:MAG TPA: alpha/beta hydrolase [Vicinamibacterales bacterium]|nr:alpha/beta hydrolase [Vicinamibacterales bacterium]
MTRAALPAVLAVILGCSIGAGCSSEDVAREAEARARRWDIPAARITRDIVYAQYGPRQLKLDVYRPPEFYQAGAAPGIVAVRGGAWREGDKEFFGYIAGQLAMEGFVTASVEYRTSDEATFPAAVQDVKAAVRWMRTHAAEYGVDPNAIGAIGGSAGAHLVAMLATTTAAALEGEGGNPAASSAVQAVVAMGGAYDLESRGNVGPEFISAVTDFVGAPLEAHAEAVAAASPIRHVSRRSAPLLLLHSPTDPLAPFGQAVAMEQAYRRAGAIVLLKAIDAPGIHGFWGNPRYFGEARRLAIEFFHRHLKVPD